MMIYERLPCFVTEAVTQSYSGTIEEAPFGKLSLTHPATQCLKPASRAPARSVSRTQPLPCLPQPQSNPGSPDPAVRSLFFPGKTGTETPSSGSGTRSSGPRRRGQRDRRAPHHPGGFRTAVLGTRPRPACSPVFILY